MSARRTGSRPRRARRGTALITVLLLAVVGSAIALVGAMMAATGTLVQNASDRSALLDDTALSGLEEARNRLNAGTDTVPLTGFRTLEDEVVVPSTPGAVVRRSTWVGRVGTPDSLTGTGEFGVQAEIVSRATDARGGVAIRRLEVIQQSFARFASFSNLGRSTNGSALWWALGAQAMGPVHSNDTIRICCPTPMNVFHEEVSTSRVVIGTASAEFRKGPPRLGVLPVPMPGAADFAGLRTLAMQAGTLFTPAWVTGDSALATMRIDFVPVDVNGDGDTTDPDEGYFRVYRLRVGGGPWGAGYAVARTPPPPAGTLDSLYNSPNCGVLVTPAGQPPRVAQTLRDLPAGTGTYAQQMAQKRAAFDHANAFCFLGGDERLSKDGRFAPSDSAGDWLPRTRGTVPAAVAARPDGGHLWPLSRALNPDFRGVIFADGRVAVSGVVRGRVTVAGSGNIIIAHELMQATNPGVTTGFCTAEDDVIGVVSAGYNIYANNTLTTPQQRRTDDGSAWRTPRKDFDPSPRRPDLTVHASLLALQSNVAEGASPPAGLPVAQWVLAGTLRIIGGASENRLGQTGSVSGSALHGWKDDMSFNRCALPFPPPFFPTTGRWVRSQYYEINPVGFSAAAWFANR